MHDFIPVGLKRLYHSAFSLWQEARRNATATRAWLLQPGEAAPDLR